ncbi:MAG TPA: hypothetical protein VEX37_04915 [Thermomicrobiales bacterium]|nr:hypothetical protein [Thermomicrobiales bacterium]
MSTHPVHGRDPEQLLHAEAYTEEELSSLVGIGVYEIRRAAREGRLRARIVDHHVISIRRDDALEWIRTLG